MIPHIVRLLVLVPLLALGAAGASRAQAGDAGPEVVTLRLPFSNVHLVKSAQPVLIDAGRPQDCEELLRALQAQGVAPARIALVIPTHGHSDHTGCAAALQAGGARIALGRGDLPMARAGDHGELTPTSLFARVLKFAAIDPRFPKFEPDIVVDGTLDLAPWGIAGRAVAMPGHTPGSLAIVLDDGRAFVGDMMLGGWFGGAFLRDRAGRHYFHADEAANNRNIAALLQQPVRSFHLGHGGPVTRASVVEGFGATVAPAGP